MTDTRPCAASTRPKRAGSGFINRFTATGTLVDALPAAATPSGAVLRVRHGCDRHGQPLAQIDRLPGDFADMRPVEMRRLAAALIAAASDCECIRANARGGDHSITLEYPL